MELRLKKRMSMLMVLNMLAIVLLTFLFFSTQVGAASSVNVESGAKYKIIASNSGLALVTENENMYSKIVQQYRDDSEKQQTWILEETSLGSGLYYIINAESGFFMDVPNSSTSNETKIIQFGYNGGHENQVWRLIDAGNGDVNIQNVHSGLNLDVPGNSTKWNEAIIQYKPNGAGNQKFKLIKIK